MSDDPTTSAAGIPYEGPDCTSEGAVPVPIADHEVDGVEYVPVCEKCWKFVDWVNGGWVH